MYSHDNESVEKYSMSDQFGVQFNLIIIITIIVVKAIIMISMVIKLLTRELLKTFEP